MPGAEGALELLAQEPVLDDGALTAADGGDEGGQDEADEFEHRGRIADHDSQDRRTDSCHLQTLPFTLMWLPVRGAPPRVAGDLLRGCVEAILAQSYGLDPSSPSSVRCWVISPTTVSPRGSGSRGLRGAPVHAGGDICTDPPCPLDERRTRWWAVAVAMPGQR